MDASDIELAAKALGVLWDGKGQLSKSLSESGRSWAMVRAGDRIRVFLVVAVGVAGTLVDPLTAALILLGHDRGLRVDVGECQRCSWKKGPMLFSSRDDARTWCRENRQPQRMITRLLGDAGIWGLWVSSRWAQWGDFEEPPCKACSGTGRHTLTWEAAIIAAMPRRAKVAGTFQGDAPTREAIAVTADAMQASGDTLGELVTAWLRGECQACDGQGMPLIGRLATLVDGGKSPVEPCRSCNGHGLLLGLFEAVVGQALDGIAARRGSLSA